MNRGKGRGIGGWISAWALAAMSLYACGGASEPSDAPGGSDAGGSGGYATCSSFQRGSPCTNDFHCSKQGSCGPCGCCSEAWNCQDGRVVYLGYNDACVQPASVCSESGSGGWTAGGSAGQSAGGGGGAAAGSASGGQSAGGTVAGEGGANEGGVGESGAGGANDGGASG